MPRPATTRSDLGNSDAERIKVELTASRRVGFQRLTYPAVAESQLIFDVSSVVAMRGRGQRVRLAKVELIDDHTLAGEVTVEGGWNPAPYTLYFHAVADRPAKAFGAWKAGQGGFETQPGRRPPGRRLAGQEPGQPAGPDDRVRHRA
jgi:putative alpha-1,2-mannosidase